MDVSNAVAAGRLRRWEAYLRNYRLPAWEEIPDIGLYMEQVLTLLKTYLDYLPPELKEEAFLTPATVNNYVRSRFMPSPVKKRYYRVHIAYLVMICTMKHGLNIGMVQKMLPAEMPEEQVKDIYEGYVRKHRATADFFVEIVKTMSAPILQHKTTARSIAAEETADLIIQSAILGGLSRLLAEKLLRLHTPEEAEVSADT